MCLFGDIGRDRVTAYVLIDETSDVVLDAGTSLVQAEYLSVAEPDLGLERSASMGDG